MTKIRTVLFLALRRVMSANLGFLSRYLGPVRPLRFRLGSHDFSSWLGQRIDQASFF